MKRKKNITISAKKHAPKRFSLGWLLALLILTLIFVLFILVGLFLGDYVNATAGTIHTIIV